MSEADEFVRGLLDGRRIASLSTLADDGAPHATAVWYLFDGQTLFVSTSSRSVKARNIAQRPQASLMVDSRQAGGELGVTAICEASLIDGQESHEINLRIHERYLRPEALDDPQVGPVFAAFDDVTIRLRPLRWIRWDMRELDAQFFGGRIGSQSYCLPLDI